MSLTSYTTMKSPIGPLLLAGDEGGLRLVHFATGRRPKSPQRNWIEDKAPFKEVIRQLEGYFEGKLKEFDVPLVLDGTEDLLRPKNRPGAGSGRLLNNRGTHRQLI